MPPLRKGPWPEWRFANDDPGAQEIRVRATLVKEALAQCPNDRVIKPIGNLEGIDRMRTHHRTTCASFQKNARELAATSKAFADAHHVADDTARWQEMLDASKAWLARTEENFAQQEKDVRAAMEAMTGTGKSDREIDFDNFPSGDDPF